MKIIYSDIIYRHDTNIRERERERERCEAGERRNASLQHCLAFPPSSIKPMAALMLLCFCLSSLVRGIGISRCFFLRSLLVRSAVHCCSRFLRWMRSGVKVF